jgi:hypothetical protein
LVLQKLIQVDQSLKYDNRIYGTVLFESVYAKERLPSDFLELVIKSVEADISTKLNLFCQIEKRLFQIESPFILDHYKQYGGYFVTTYKREIEQSIGSPVLLLENKYEDIQVVCGKQSIHIVEDCSQAKVNDKDQKGTHQ